MDETLQAMIDKVEAISAPAVRARAAGSLIDDLAAAQKRLSQLRHQDVVELRKTFKIREVAEMLGKTNARVSQIYKGT